MGPLQARQSLLAGTVDPPPQRQAGELDAIRATADRLSAESLETDGATALCTLRLAVRRAGTKGQDGYFDVKCFEAQAQACAQYLKAGARGRSRRAPPVRRVQTQDAAYASRRYIVARRVEFFASHNRPNGRASEPPEDPAAEGAPLSASGPA